MCHSLNTGDLALSLRSLFLVSRGARETASAVGPKARPGSLPPGGGVYKSDRPALDSRGPVLNYEC